MSNAQLISIINNQANCTTSNGIKLIINAEEYAQTVLLQGREIPWHNATAYANHLRQTVALLNPEVAVISLDQMIIQELQDNQALVGSMGAKSRSGFALKTFMGNEEFKTAAGNLVTNATQSLQIPIMIQLPSPLELLYLTAKAAKPDAEHEFDDDQAENASVYYADWLRAFTDASIAGLIFDERPKNVVDEVYQPVNNTAEHYQWSVAVRRETELIFHAPNISVPVLATDYWLSGKTDVQMTTLAFSQIAKDAVPEQVLTFMKELK